MTRHTGTALTSSDDAQGLLHSCSEGNAATSIAAEMSVETSDSPQPEYDEDLEAFLDPNFTFDPELLPALTSDDILRPPDEGMSGPPYSLSQVEQPGLPGFESQAGAATAGASRIVSQSSTSMMGLTRPTRPLVHQPLVDSGPTTAAAPRASYAADARSPALPVNLPGVPTFNTSAHPWFCSASTIPAVPSIPPRLSKANHYYSPRPRPHHPSPAFQSSAPYGLPLQSVYAIPHYQSTGNSTRTYPYIRPIETQNPQTYSRVLQSAVSLTPQSRPLPPHLSTDFMWKGPRPYHSKATQSIQRKRIHSEAFDKQETKQNVSTVYTTAQDQFKHLSMQIPRRGNVLLPDPSVNTSQRPVVNYLRAKKVLAIGVDRPHHSDVKASKMINSQSNAASHTRRKGGDSTKQEAIKQDDTATNKGYSLPKNDRAPPHSPRRSPRLAVLRAALEENTEDHRPVSSRPQSPDDRRALSPQGALGHLPPPIAYRDHDTIRDTSDALKDMQLALLRDPDILDEQAQSPSHRWPRNVRWIGNELSRRQESMKRVGKKKWRRRALEDGQK